MAISNSCGSSQLVFFSGNNIEFILCTLNSSTVLGSCYLNFTLKSTISESYLSNVNTSTEKSIVVSKEL